MNEQGDGFTEERIEERIRAFESFGIHRTGWDGDDRTSAWLVGELRAAGIEARLERFDFPRVEVRTARIAWDSGSADGLPMYDGGFTDASGIDGELTADDDPDPFGKLLVATSALAGDRSWLAPDARAKYEGLQEQGVVGVIVPAGDPDGHLAARNAEAIRSPFGLPVLQVAPNDLRELHAAMLAGTEGVLIVDGERLRSRATNVVATLPGSDPEARPVGVMTPKSGWFTCAAERGGGIATWLALAEWLAAMPGRERPVELVASSGHELHHLGLTAYLREHSGIATHAVAWLHLGASIGARYPNARLAASDELLHTAALGAIAAAGAGEVDALPAGAPGGGEARDIDAAGGRYVSFLGGHRYFHSPQDTVDLAVDTPSVARWAHAARDLVGTMLTLEG
ncbi:MAG: hypothetical protein GEU80_08565 [Dehalococcoidia bacterium]|nr:hypothetical protein [Dehalococcoidia bacterium]